MLISEPQPGVKATIQLSEIEDRQALLQCEAIDVIELTIVGVSRLSERDAQNLAKFKGLDIHLPDTVQIDGAGVDALARFQGQWIHLPDRLAERDEVIRLVGHLLPQQRSTRTECRDDGLWVSDPDGTIVNSIGMKLVPIQPGKFLMGSVDDPDHEEFRHTVELTSHFYMGMYPVTQTEYVALMGENPSRFIGKNRPVTHVSWQQATEYCHRLSNLDLESEAGRHYRLPTEAEWEYCCRAGTATPFAFGEQLRDDQACFASEWETEPRRPKTVGSFSANAWGLHDMHGLVWEWCQDWFAADYFRESPEVDPLGPIDGPCHVLRGGSASVMAIECSSSSRGEAAGDQPDPSSIFRFAHIGDFGLRVVVEIQSS